MNRLYIVRILQLLRSFRICVGVAQCWISKPNSTSNDRGDSCFLVRSSFHSAACHPRFCGMDLFPTCFTFPTQNIFPLSPAQTA